MAILVNGSNPFFAGFRVRLRSVSAADLTKLIEWDNDPEITQWAGKRFTRDEEAKRWYLSGNSLQRRTFAIELTQGDLIGVIEVMNISWRLHTAEIRILIGEKHLWGKGLGEEAMRILASILFKSTSLRKVFLRVSDENIRAKRCYQKVGFKPQGKIRLDLGSDKPESMTLMTLTPQDLKRASLKPSNRLDVRPGD